MELESRVSLLMMRGCQAERQISEGSRPLRGGGGDGLTIILVTELLTLRDEGEWGFCSTHGKAYGVERGKWRECVLLVKNGQTLGRGPKVLVLSGPNGTPFPPHPPKKDKSLTH